MTGFELNVLAPNDEPTVAIDEPTPGEVLSGETTVAGTASDPDGSVERVQVRVDGGAWRNATGTTDWSYAWDTVQVADGEHTLEVRSFDGRDHSSIASVTVETDNPHPDLAVDRVDVDPGLTSATVRAEVDNEGEAEASATSLLVRYEADNAQGVVGEDALPALAAGENLTVEMTWDTSDKVGEFQVTAVADPDDEVLDFTPANDERRETACVPGLEGATCPVPGTEAPG
jgi:hypothetical protein